jgi:hypothetical protein
MPADSNIRVAVYVKTGSTVREVTFGFRRVPSILL